LKPPVTSRIDPYYILNLLDFPQCAHDPVDMGRIFDGHGEKKLDHFVVLD
jgi:hypothetical protein